MKRWMCIFMLSTSGSGFCADVYGVDPIVAQQILRTYEKDLVDFESAVQQGLPSAVHEHVSSAPGDELSKKKQALMDKIAKDNHFLFVDFETIFYPQEQGGAFYTTIEVVDKKHPERLRFVSHHVPQGRASIPSSPDVIDAMLHYTELGVQLMVDHKLGKGWPACPVYHCTVGFEHPQLAPYLPVFNRSVLKEKQLILDTLNHASSPERRGAAAFLVGHFQDPKEIVRVLSSHVSDPDEGVRNNVMRVIAETIEKAKMTDIDPRPFIEVLASPYTSDRNKALFVLTTLAESPQSKQVILEEGGAQLLALMRLQQPNNHGEAYTILKKISGQDFDSEDLGAWSSWVRHAKPKHRGHGASAV